MTLGERCARIWSYVQHAPRQLPSTVRIPSQHVEKSGAITSAGDGPTAPTAFVPDEHYFQVRVNEMFLVNQREWFKDYDPIAFVTTEFLYQDQSEALPFVVGPSMMQNFQSTTPTGMIFANTGVAGPHPYRGGALKLTMILGRIERTDHARRFLGWIDNATKIFDFATALGAYLKVGNLILEGIEALTGNGGNNLLAGLRNEINPRRRRYVHSRILRSDRSTRRKARRTLGGVTINSIAAGPRRTLNPFETRTTCSTASCRRRRGPI